MNESYIDYLEKGQKLYVRNMTRNPYAVVTMTFRTRSGLASDLVRIPPSKLPFELCPRLVSKDTVLEGGQQLSLFIASGALKLVPAKEAQEILKSPEAQEEADALLRRTNNDAVASQWARKEMKNSEKGGQHPANPKDVEIYADGPGGVDILSRIGNRDPVADLKDRLGMVENSPSRSQHQLQMSGVDPNVNTRVVGIMANWAKDTELSNLKNLKTLKSQLKSHDIRYILDHSNKNSQTYKWAKKLRTKNG